MKESEKIYAEAAEIRAKATEYADKAFLYFAAACTVAVLGTFVSVVVFIGWYIETSMGGKAASPAVQWCYAGMLTLAAVMLVFIVMTLWVLFDARRKRLAAIALHAEATITEAEEAEIERQKLARKQMAEFEEAERVKREGAATAAQRVAKAVQETRDERRVERTDGKNKPGGSAGRFKEV